MAFFFSRDTKVFMTHSYDGTTANTALFEIPVLDGFSFSQGTNTSEVTLNEAANSTGYSKRGRAMFTDSYAPAEWSFSTYMRPTVSGTSNAAVSNEHAGNAKVFAVEGPLWSAMSAPGGTQVATSYDKSTGVFESATLDFANGAAVYEPKEFNFAKSNQVTLGVFDLYFVLGASKDTDTTEFASGTDGVTVYKLANCSIGSASIDFDIDGIATVAWSGQGQKIEEDIGSGEGSALNTAASGTTALGLINEGISSTSNYVRQKLTNLTMVYDAANTTGVKTGSMLGTSNNTFSGITLTGGNITIENNLTYLTPETLGSVNQPLGHVMGTRSVSGNFTCYLNDATGGSAELFEDLQESREIITNAFDLKFSIGGQSESNHINVHVPKAHLELPSHSIEDVISVDVNFHGLATDLTSSTEANATNEVKVTYAAS